MENEEMLIDLVKLYPVLYDRSKKEFRDTAMKERAWCAIAECLKVSAQECSQRWGSLRDKFVREMKAENGLPSGSGAQNKKIWPLKEAIMWLQPYIRTRKTFGNCLNSSSSACTSIAPTLDLPPSTTTDAPVCSPSPTPVPADSPSPESFHSPPYSPSPTPAHDTFHARKRKQGEDLESALISSLGGFKKLMRERAEKKEEDEELDLFCRSLTLNLKRLDKKKQNQAKRELLEVMFKYE